MVRVDGELVVGRWKSVTYWLILQFVSRAFRSKKETMMTKLLVLARAALALSVSVLPLTASVDMGGFHVKTLAAFAKDGHSGSDGGGGGSSGRGGGDSDSDNDGGDSDGDHDGGDSDGDHDGGGRSGRGGGDDNDRDSDDSDDDGGDDDNGGRHGTEHVDPSTGAKIEVSGSSIEVRYPNGVKEELENGRYEMKDSSGRTIVERVATAEDIARLTDLAN
jgi:hypothetical protein